MECDDGGISSIQKAWRRRLRLKRDMNVYFEYLYDRHTTSIRTFNLIDDSLDDRIETLLTLYDRTMNKLHLPTYDKLCTIRTNADEW